MITFSEVYQIANAGGSQRATEASEASTLYGRHGVISILSEGRFVNSI